MAGGLSGVFASPQQGVPMAAPGLPVAALSGNPWATLTNINAIGGSVYGQQIGGALAGAIGQLPQQAAPQLPPQQTVQARQQAAFGEIQQRMASGASYGEAVSEVSKAGYLAPDESLRMLAFGQEQLGAERKSARDMADGLYNSDAYKDFVSSKNNWLAMKDLAGKGGNTSIHNFTMLQRFLKTVDPNSATLQGEIDAAKLSTTGMQSLKNVFGDSEVANVMAGLMRFQAGGGNMLTLNESQKRKLLDAAGQVVGGMQRSAISTLQGAQSSFLGTGGSEAMFTGATQAANKELNWSYKGVMLGDGDTPPAEIAGGSMPNNWLGIAAMADQRKEAVNSAIAGVTKDAAKVTAILALDMASAGVDVAADLGRRAFDWASETFGHDAEASTAAGAAMAIDPLGTAQQLELHYGTGSNILNISQDILLDGKVSKQTGRATISPLIDAMQTKVDKRRIKKINRGKRDKRPLLPVEPPGQAKMP